MSAPNREFPVESLNAAICRLVCSSAFLNKDVPSYQGFFNLANGWGGRGNHLGTLNNQCCMPWWGIPYGYTR